MAWWQRAAEVFGVFLRLGLSSFGGPAAHIGFFRDELVTQRRWVNEEQFAQLLAICQFLPGPASSQLGFSLGLVRAGWLGAMAAFVGFTAPSAVFLVAFAASVPMLDERWSVAAIHGLKIVALAVVADAAINMAKTLCPDLRSRLIAASTTLFVVLSSAASSQLVAVGLAGVLGVLIYRNGSPAGQRSTLQLSYGMSTGLVLLLLFVALLFVLQALSGNAVSPVSIASVFYQAGALVFGGGHVVLPLLDEAVVGRAWLSADEFVAGYGAAQMIPGPLFAFSAYLGALLGAGWQSAAFAAIALLFIFLPGFLLVAAVLPMWTKVNQSAWARRAITAINAAVVGLLLAALYDPIWTSAIVSPVDVAIALFGFVLLARAKRAPIIVVMWCVAASVFVSQLG